MQCPECTKLMAHSDDGGDASNYHFCVFCGCIVWDEDDEDDEPYAWDNRWISGPYSSFT